MLMQAAAANKKDAAMFSRMFKPSKEKPTAADADAKENAAPAAANGHDKSDVVENAEAVVMETEEVTAGQGAGGVAEAEPVSAAAIK